MQWGELPADSVRKKRQLLRQIDHQISRHGRMSAFGHLLVFLYVEWLIGFAGLSPVQTYVFGLLFLLVAAWRLVLLLRFDVLYGRGPKRWRQWYGAVTLAGAAVWSTFLVLTIVLPGYDASLTFLWVYTTAVAATHIYIYAPYPQMAKAYNRIMLIPPGLAGIAMLEPEYSTLGAGVLLFYVFMQRMGQRVTDQYWATVENNEKLEYELGRLSASEHRMALQASDNDRFTANLTAMIRTPLNGVLGMLSLLSSNERSREERKLVAVASRSANALAELVDDFDTFVRVKGHMLNDEARVFNITRHLESVMESLGPVAHAHWLELSYTLKPGMPERVKGSSRQITTLFKQLTSFAVSAATGDEVSMKVQPETGTDGIVISVRFESDLSDATLEDLQSVLRTEHGSEALSTIDLTRLSLMICTQIVRQSAGYCRLSILDQDSPRLYQLNVSLPLEPSTQDAQPFDPSRSFSAKKVLMAGFPRYGEQSVRGEMEGWGMQVDVCDLTTLDNMPARDIEKFDYCVISVPVRGSGDQGEALLRLPARLDALTRAPRVLLLVTAEQRDQLRQVYHLDQLLSKPIPRRTLHRWLLKKPIRRDDDATDDQLPQLNSWRVLVAEDNRVNATVARKLLQRFGVTVELADSGAHALELYQVHSFDMVWVDQALSDMSGHEAVALIRNYERAEGSESVVILGISRSRDASVERNCLAAGMDDVLVKPLDLAQVADTLQRHMN